MSEDWNLDLFDSLTFYFSFFLFFRQKVGEILSKSKFKIERQVEMIDWSRAQSRTAIALLNYLAITRWIITLSVLAVCSITRTSRVRWRILTKRGQFDWPRSSAEQSVWRISRKSMQIYVRNRAWPSGFGHREISANLRTAQMHL